MVLLTEKISVTESFQIPITLSKEFIDDEPYFVIDVDGVEWLDTDNEAHASVLFRMMQEHITEYYHYEPK